MKKKTKNTNIIISIIIGGLMGAIVASGFGAKGTTILPIIIGIIIGAIIGKLIGDEISKRKQSNH